MVHQKEAKRQKVAIGLRRMKNGPKGIHAAAVAEKRSNKRKSPSSAGNDENAFDFAGETEKTGKLALSFLAVLDLFYSSLTRVLSTLQAPW